MSKDVAVIGVGGEVVAINVQTDDYAPAPYEVEVTGAAYIGGDYVGGYFYPPQPFPSWTRNKGNWEPPIPYPADGKLYSWNEENGAWEEIS